jgi:hypothetical protein
VTPPPLWRPAAARRTAALLIALTLAAYLPGFTWGIPQASSRESMHAWGNDDLVPLAPLAEMYNTFVREEPLRNFAYPWGHYALVAGAYAPYLGPLYLRGELRQPTSRYPFGLARPQEAFRALAFIGRTVTLALAVGCVLAAWMAGLALAGPAGGIATALATLLLYPMSYYAKLGNLDVPVLAWTAIGLAACAWIVRHGATVRRAVVLGVALAMAGATKDQAAGSFVLLLPAVLLLHLSREGWQRRAWRAPLAMLGAFVPVYVLASGIPVDPDRYARHLGLVLGVGAQGALYLRHPATASGYAMHLEDLGHLLVQVMGWPLLALSLAGVSLAVRRERTRLVFLLSSLGFLVMLLPVRFSRIHYLLPVALPLTFYAGIAVQALWSRGGRWRHAAAGVLGLAVLPPLLWTVDLTHAMLKDSRYAAAAFLEAHARTGDTLLSFGAPLRLPRLPAGMGLHSVAWRAEASPTIARLRPAFVIVQPEDTNEDRHRVEWREGPHSVFPDYLPPALYDQLADGSIGYRLVAQYQTPRVLPWVERPFLSYPTVNPPIQLFVRDDRAGDLPRLAAWRTAPHHPPVRHPDRLTVEWRAGRTP